MPRAVVLLTLAGAALRSATLDTQSFWFDEAATVELVRMGLGDMLDQIPERESTPPLYYLLAWLWAKLFGHGEVGLRSLSALVGTASIPVFYAAAAELCSRRVGVAVAALASFSPLLVWYSQEARAYALLVLLCALSLLLFARLLRRPTARAAAGFGLVSALALASHYFAIFVVVPEAIWLMTRPNVRRRALPAVAGLALAALALLPLALHQRSQGLASFIADDPLALRLARTGKGFLVGFDAPLEVTLALVAAVVSLGGLWLGLTRAGTDDRHGARIAAGLAAVAVAVPIVVALAGADYVDTRNLLAVWLPLVTAAGAGLMSPSARRLGTAGVGVLCLIGLASTVGVLAEPAWQRDDWRGLGRALEARQGPRVVAVQPATGAPALRLYLSRAERLSREGAEVSEIAVVHPPRRDTGETHPGASPAPRNVTLPGFTRAQTQIADSYTLVMYRAPRPRVVLPVELDPILLVPREPASALLQR